VSDNSHCTTFMSAPQLFFTSESVTEGHPDKICDQISDAVLDAILKDDPMARVACETAVTTGLIVVMGEITTNTYVDIGTVARDVVRDIGYTRGKFGFDADTCGVIVSIKEQSRDIAQGVDRALEQRTGVMSEEELNKIGAGDQGHPALPAPGRQEPGHDRIFLRQAGARRYGGRLLAARAGYFDGTDPRRHPGTRRAPDHPDGYAGRKHEVLRQPDRAFRRRWTAG
jgi:hypothetical protein